MTLSGGHFENFTEAMKYTQPTLVPGHVMDNQLRGNIIDTLATITGDGTGEQIDWLRKTDDTSSDVEDSGKGTTTVLTEGATAEKITAYLKQCYKFEALDKFYPSIHQTKNNYEEIQYQSMVNDMLVRLGNKVIYDDITYGGALQMDGLHALAAVSAGENWDVDAGHGALSLLNWRNMKDEMKHGVDFWFVPYWLPTYLGAAFQEKGLAGLATATAGTMGNVQWNVNQLGSRIMTWDGVPLIPSDFLVAEQVDTGIGSDIRAKYSSGTAMYSLFGIKNRNAGVEMTDPGVALVAGTVPNDGMDQMINLEYFDKLEGKIASALRTSIQSCLINGSKYSISRMFDFTKAAIVV